MSSPIETLASAIAERLGDAVESVSVKHGELTLQVPATKLLRICRVLRDEEAFRFEQLMDVAGVDYLHYGREAVGKAWDGPRFAVTYHLLSVTHNRRVRIHVFLDEELPVVESVVGIWASANWFEREAFDLYGIVFEGHPDLRRILTDYGFVGHPFRKDFPLIGNVEMRYDPDKKRVVYEPVSIEPRTLVPRVIREEGYGGRDS